MKRPASLLSRARTFAAALLLSLLAVRPAAAVDWTDIWWTVPEIGWGVNFVQSDKFIFATFYLHDVNQQPDWYTGEMTVDANGVWSGKLYRTTGSYFGAPWSGYKTDPVGTVTFTPSSSYAGTLTWNVFAVTVTKQITRLTLTTIPLGGTYKGALVSDVKSCNNPNDNGTFTANLDLVAAQTASGATGNLQLDLTVSAGGGTGACRFAGTYTQDGRLFRMPNAAYTCGSSFQSTANVTQVTATAQGIEGQWAAPVGGGCIEYGYFSAVYLY